MKIYNNIPLEFRPGIYAIRNITKGWSYVGSSNCIYNRLKAHKSTLKNHSVIVTQKVDYECNDVIQFIVLKTYGNGTISNKYLRDKENTYILRYRERWKDLINTTCYSLRMCDEKIVFSPLLTN